MLSPVFAHSSLSRHEPAKVRDCIAWMKSQFGFDENDSEQFQLHDLMHILGDAVSGTIIDERRAAITEHYLLSTCLVNSIVANGRVVANGPRMGMEELADNYVKNGRLAILEKVRSETLNIVENIVRHPVDSFFVPSDEQRVLIDQQLADSETIKNLQALLAPFALTLPQQEEAVYRAQAIDLHFRMNNGGRKLDMFKIDDILDMPISAFGIIPSEINGNIKFETILPVSPSVFMQDFNF